MAQPFVQHASHWGVFSARVHDGSVEVVPDPDDPHPSAILGNVAAALTSQSRILRPAIRRGWLDNGPGPDSNRGWDSYVEVPWDEALDLLARELDRVRTIHGNASIYGGSYGWASAGRFHHAQSQVHRFLNQIGGYTRSVNSYSGAAAEVLMPHVLAPQRIASRQGVLWTDIVEGGRLVVAFGGLPAKNNQIDSGGSGKHVVNGHIAEAAHRGVRFVNIGPLRDDLAGAARPTWHPVRPATDTALMLGLAYVLIDEDLIDEPTIDEISVGFRSLADYIVGRADGVPKDPEWAEAITGMPRDDIRELARDMAAGPCLITVSQSLQRAEHGEQPVWMGIALATLLGEIGLPGRGFCYGLGSMAGIGVGRGPTTLPALPQGSNPVDTFIPVARVMDMLLAPGGQCAYDGHVVTYPDVRLVYWAGGNPFHHHQDLGRLSHAFGRPDTIVVHEPFWTSAAKHADIVLPATTTLERNDIASVAHDPRLVAMQQVSGPVGESRSDYAIFSDLAARMGVGASFTAGRSEREWLEHLYGQACDGLAEIGWTMPAFEEFWHAGQAPLPPHDASLGPVERFRTDPRRHRLPTPSGRIELFSEVISDLGYDDCAGHPRWFEPAEWHGSDLARTYPLMLVANQPSRRLHSQLDFGQTSVAGKERGMERARMNPADAADRDLTEGDTVRLFNDRGSCYAALQISNSVIPGVVQLSTGAWYAPPSQDNRSTCLGGNPNTLTADRGTSSLAQGSTGQHALVDVEKTDIPDPSRSAHDPPQFESFRRSHD